VTFFNAEQFLTEAIHSVLQQTYGNWELILVDDGSSDASTLIAREFQARDRDRIRYVEHPGHVNRGGSASRNRGLAVASGELIAFLDADDVYMPERLERHVQALERYPEVQAVQSSLEFWHSWRGTPAYTPENIRERPPPVAIGVPIQPPELLLLLCQTGRRIVPGICSITVRAPLFATAGGFEDSFRGLYDDQVVYAKLYLDATVLVLDECLARYRRHPQSTTQLSKRQDEFRARLAFLTWLQSYLRARAIDHPLIWDALRREFRSLSHPLLWKIGHLPGVVSKIARSHAQHMLPSQIIEPAMRWWGKRKVAAADAVTRRIKKEVAAKIRNGSSGQKD
jgi:glycosyltransferase involved in cell wall biosynthesis